MVTMVGVAAVNFVPVERALVTFYPLIDPVGGELIVVELVLNGVGGVLDESVEAIGGIVHIFKGYGSD